MASEVVLVTGSGSVSTPAAGVLTVQGIVGGVAIPISGSISSTFPLAGNADGQATSGSGQGSGIFGLNTAGTWDRLAVSVVGASIAAATKGVLGIQGITGGIPVPISGSITTSFPLAGNADGVATAGTGQATGIDGLNAAGTYDRIRTSVVGTTIAAASPGILGVQGVTGGVALPVSGTFWQATQPVSGTFWQATQPVSGTVTDNQGTANTVANAWPIKVTDATNTAAVKAGVIAVASDNPLVVTMHPSSAPMTTQPVTLTSTTITGTVAVTESGTWTVQPGNTANTTPWLFNLTQINSVALGSPTALGTAPTGNVLSIQGGGATANALPVLQSGTWTVQPGNTANTTAWLVNGPTLTKGTQGTVGFAVQELKDSGRTRLTFKASAIASVIAETVVTCSQNKGGTETTGVTTYTVTAAKTLRIQSIRFSVRFAVPSTTVTFAQATLRLREASVTGPRVVEHSYNVAANTNSLPDMIDFPDGLEFPAATVLNFTQVASATTLLVDVEFVGYEY